MVNPIKDRSFCGIPINAAACLVAVLHLVFIFVSSVAYFSALNGNTGNINLPYDVRAVILANFGQTEGEYYVVWFLLGAQFVAALLVLFGTVVQCGKFLWPLIVINIGVVSQDLFVLMADVINRRNLSLQQLTYFALIAIAFYLTSVVYRAKRHIDFVRQQRRDFELFRASAKEDNNIKPSAPPENEYYELRY
ncbi:hypothetical protein M3Y98_01171500 [Aphelenchoides besseyi]|nr:hypothetical protein M3Y98_01171500 [Aphelenchoides besseyi]KAI6210972.1 hypothetical protein M3Y96_00384100 [Aphelenchoides besseyi]